MRAMLKWRTSGGNFPRRLLPGLVLSLIFSGTVALACNVPVFRYALERWQADSYQAVLFHRGPLSEQDREALRPLEEKIETNSVNLQLRFVDVAEHDTSETENPDAALLATLGEPSFPTLVVQYPAQLKIAKPIWNGSPTPEAIDALTQSPARQELIRRLAAGQTAVWILLESGNGEADQAAAALLEVELARLEKDLKLPELTDSPDDTLLVDAPLEIKFSLLRVQKNSDDERALVGMLIGSEPDLADRSDPMVFPVFGRGRALFPLIGAGITARNIHDSGAFLVGPCSCEVKELNPGFDLLLSVAWDEQLDVDPELLASVPTRTIPDGPPELVEIPAGAAKSTSATAAVPEAASSAKSLASAQGANEAASSEESDSLPAEPAVDRSPDSAEPVGRRSWIAAGVIGLVVVLALGSWLGLQRS